MPHPDNDQWKHTMFTNKSYISAHHIDKILQVNVITMSKKKMVNIFTTGNNVQKNDKKIFSHKMYYIITRILS